MKYKEFSKWCNDRACDGCWSFNTAVICIEILSTVRKIPWYKREKTWKKEYETFVVEEIVKPIEQKIREFQSINY